MKKMIKKKTSSSKYGWLTKVKGEKDYFISFGYTKKQLPKLRKDLKVYNQNKNKYGFARILTKDQYQRLMNTKGRLTNERIKRIIRRK